jgi:hypothetical protein
VATITIRENDGTWQNTTTPEDVDADLDVEPQDVLRLADDYRANGPRQLTQTLSAPALWSDVNGDTIVSPADILAVLDAVNRKSFFGGGLLATSEPSVAAASETPSNLPSVDAEVAIGLAAPAGSSGAATTKLPLTPPAVIATPSLTPATPIVRAAAVDSALTELADDADSSDSETDEDLYELIAIGG